MNPQWQSVCVLSPPSPSLSPSLSLYSRRPPRERARAHIVSIRCAHNAQPGKRERQSQRSGSLSLSLSFSFSITGFCWHSRMAAVCWSLLIHSYTFVHSYKTVPSYSLQCAGLSYTFVWSVCSFLLGCSLLQDCSFLYVCSFLSVCSFL